MKGRITKLITIHFVLFTIIFSFLIPIQNIMANQDYVIITFDPQPNYPPYKPMNPDPPHGSTDIRSPVILSVDVYDFTGDYVNVYFYNASNHALIGVDWNVTSDWSTASVVWNESLKGQICIWYAVASDYQNLQNISEVFAFATRPNQPSIIHNNEYPYNTSSNMEINVTCHIEVSDEDADLMTIYWYENSTGSWVERQRNTSVPNGTYYWTFQEAIGYFETYYWKVVVNTSMHNVSEIFYFRTIDNQKLTITNPNPSNESTTVSTNSPYWYINISDYENDSFNWKIESSPNVGSASGNNSFTGQKACTLANLSFNVTYIMYVNATDAGNGTWVNDTFWFTTVIQEAPSISNEFPPNRNTWTNLRPTCHVDVHDLEGDNLTVYWYENSTGSWVQRKNETNVTANSTVYWTFLEAITYSTDFYWRVVVNDGTYNTTGEYYFTTRPRPSSGDPPQPPSGGGGYTPPPNQHPIANITGPYIGYVNENLVFFGFYSYDPDGYLKGYRWDFDNDGEYDTDWLDDLLVEHRYNKSGNYTVRLQVKDNLNAVTTSDPHNIKIIQLVEPQQLPIANIDGSYSGYNDVNIIFSSKGSFDPDGEIINYSWNFGDGNISYHRNPVHSYSEPGNYTVSLTVTDNDNLTNSTVKKVTILDKEKKYIEKKDRDQPFILLLLFILAIVSTIIALFIRSKTYRFTVLIEKVDKPNKKKKKSVNVDLMIEKRQPEIEIKSDIGPEIDKLQKESYNREKVHDKIDKLLLETDNEK